MNLVLKDEHIHLLGVAEDLETVLFRDDIGFTTQDLVSGFNASDAGTPAEDGIGNPYPVPEATVTYLFVTHFPYSSESSEDVGTSLFVTRTSNVILDPVTEADLADVGFDYGAVMNNFSVTSEKDGWLRAQMFVLDVDAPGEDYYYDSTQEVIIESSTGEEVSPETLINVVQTVSADLFKTSKLDYQIAEIESAFTFAKMRGKCPDKDAWREHIAHLQVGRTSAKIQFDTFGNTWNAAYILEELEQYIIINELDNVTNGL